LKTDTEIIDGAYEDQLAANFRAFVDGVLMEDAAIGNTDNPPPAPGTALAAFQRGVRFTKKCHAEAIAELGKVEATPTLGFVVKDVMPKINGKSFRCACGCNVFKEFAPLRYRCNGCQATFSGEK
jgi:hypothetical protein